MLCLHITHNLIKNQLKFLYLGTLLRAVCCEKKKREFPFLLLKLTKNEKITQFERHLK